MTQILELFQSHPFSFDAFFVSNTFRDYVLILRLGIEDDKHSSLHPVLYLDDALEVYLDTCFLHTLSVRPFSKSLTLVNSACWNIPAAVSLLMNSQKPSIFWISTYYQSKVAGGESSSITLNRFTLFHLFFINYRKQSKS